MSEETLPAPGWYPAEHADGEHRFWDGRQWLEGRPTTISEPVPGDTASIEQAIADPAPSRPPFMQRPMKRKAGAIVATAAFVVGLLMGAGTGGSGAQTRVNDLEAEVAALQEQVGGLEESALELEAEAASANDARVAAEDELVVSDADLTRAEADLETATARVVELEAEAAGRQAELESHIARIADLESAVPAPVAPVQVQESVSVSFANCSEARAAGAAPVRQGDPGYGRHLDRDGDGVGCE